MNKQDELRLEALDKLQSLESTVGSTRRDLEQGKVHRLSETGHLISLASQVDLLIARLVEVSRKT